MGKSGQEFVLGTIGTFRFLADGALAVEKFLELKLYCSGAKQCPDRCHQDGRLHRVCKERIGAGLVADDPVCVVDE
jgi:hypothetical protein